MIRCPNCGTVNQDSKKACTHCGAALPQTSVRCPNCGALNAFGNILCDRCNTRLIKANDVVPSELLDRDTEAENNVPVKGISLPTRTPDDEDAEGELPSWLRDLTDASDLYDAGEDTTVGELAADDDAGAEEVAAYPDWLSNLLDDNPDFDTAPSEAEDADAGLNLDESALPDWFTGADTEDEASEEDIGADFAGENLPAGYDDADSEPTTGEPVGDEMELPDWLIEGADIENAEIAPSSAAGTPDWLLANAVDLPTDEDADYTGVPDWLLTASGGPASDLSGGDVEGAPENAEEDGAQLFADTDLPDWLVDTEPYAEETSEPKDGPDGSQPEHPVAEASRLDDTGEDFDTSLSASTAGGMDEADEELPDWLLASEEEADVELPDWLMTLAEDSEEPSELETRTAEAEAAPEEGASASPTEGPAVSETGPDDQPSPSGAGEQVLSLRRETPEDLAGEQPEEEPLDLPAWLAGLDVASAPEESDTIVFEDEGPGSLEPPRPEDRPSWLEELKPPAEASDIERRAPAFVPGGEDTEGGGTASSLSVEQEEVEVPEWLQGLDLGGPQADVDVAGPGAQDLARAELPSWLQELAPEEIADQVSGAPVFEGSDELVSADIPDWVRALQPSPEEGEAARSRAGILPTPAEPEGPLEGIPGVLQSMDLLDAPAGVAPVADTPIAESVMAQAKLWQQLLERPRMGERPVSQQRERSSVGATWVRILLTVILIAGLFGAFWLLPEDLQLAPTPPGEQAPGAAALATALDELQPGESVILAVEYGNAYAEEMGEIAAPLLEHLNAREADVLVVSTLPEGRVLSTMLAAELTQVSDAPTGRYLAGNASGIADLLSTTEANTAQHVLVLASHPERVRWWVEQVSLANQDRTVPLGVSAGVSAATGPRVAPYLQSRGIEGWLVGFPDALAYRALRAGGDIGRYSRILDILMLAHVASAVLLVVGLIVTAVTGKKGQR